jgi:hypothetical protein
MTPHRPRGSRHVVAPLLVVIAAALSASTVSAGVIVGYDTSTLASHNTYDNYSSGFFSTSPVRNTNPAFVGAGLDLTGIGYMADNGLQAVTLISPQYFIMAAHFPPTTNQVKFVSASNQVRTYTIQSTAVLNTTTFNGSTVNQPSDLLIGRLSSPIPAADGIGFLPVAIDPGVDLIGGPIPPTTAFSSLPLMAHGHNDAYINPFAMNGTSPHLGLNVLDRGPMLSSDNLGNVVIGYDFNPAMPGEFHAIEGDSGGPSLARIGGQAALAGLHYDLLAGNTSIDTLVAYYINQMNAFMAPDSMHVTVAPIPEPNTLTLLSVGAAIGWMRRRARRKAG